MPLAAAPAVGVDESLTGDRCRGGGEPHVTIPPRRRRRHRPAHLTLETSACRLPSPAPGRSRAAAPPPRRVPPARPRPWLAVHGGEHPPRLPAGLPEPPGQP